MADERDDRFVPLQVRKPVARPEPATQLVGRQAAAHEVEVHVAERRLHRVRRHDAPQDRVAGVVELVVEQALGRPHPGDLGVHPGSSGVDTEAAAVPTRAPVETNGTTGVDIDAVETTVCFTPPAPGYTGGPWASGS